MNDMPVGNALKQLEAFGQSPWLDFIQRSFTAQGKLQEMVDRDGLKGVTSNPSIFQKAMGEGTDYDDGFKVLAERGDHDAQDIYEALAIEDIQHACDVMRPVWEATGKVDGYVSLEVSPYLALRTDETVAGARKLWKAVGRGNLMVKVPGTDKGVAAIRTLISDGMNINVTLLFAQKAYEAVAEAFIAGLEDRVARGESVAGISSVASFFVSRIDAVMDKRIDERVAKGEAALLPLRGKVAIANAKMAYQTYLKMVGSPRWAKLSAAGALPQRLLWASTGVKDKAYSDVLYVEELIGRDTVNTIPPATMDAFRDHGHPRASLEKGLDDARAVMAAVETHGLDLDGVTDKLVQDGVELFAEAADKLLGSVNKKLVAIRASHPQSMELGIVGLGRMGGNISQRLMPAGHKTVVYDRNEAVVHGLADKGAQPSTGLADMVAKLTPPRAIWVMLPAGKITEATVSDLADLLAPGDTIIDGGNTYYKDDIRRARTLREKGITYVDVGTSGGIWGIERGYCMMIGGEKEAVDRLDPIFAALAPGLGTIERTPERQNHDPRSEQGYIHAGPAGAGHFVKMVHNGIEYGMMQAYAEGFDILRSKASEALPEHERFTINTAEVAETWRRGSVVSSWLLDLTSIALAKDGDLDSYKGDVEDSGEGRWPIEAAIEEAVPAPVITASLFARFESRRKHSFANKLLSAMRAGFGGHVEPKTPGVIPQPLPKPDELKVQEHEREV